MSRELEEIYKNVYPDTDTVIGFGDPSRFLQVLQSDVCLDMGCGGGIDCQKLAQRTSGLIVGIDKQEQMITYAEKYNNKGIRYILEDIEVTGFPDMAFNKIISNCAFLHIENKSLILDEIKRLLKPKGQFCFSDITFRDFAPRQNDLAITSDAWKDLLVSADFSEWHLVEEKNIYREGMYHDLFVSTFWGIK